ncbi:MAG: tRNA (adenosine(37)-N6)-dimethylallyltransferase MiaA [Elusimicrobia bacterium]|nr:tRNA (adenosine(37)-N6)-dimethylallyltransferase MiaA [Elusimicrobiota bacterium]
MKNVIVIAGPTATGKTEVAIKLAKKINGEIISADSRQIYKYLDIGTNKPAKKQLSSVKHYLIDIIEPTENFTAGDFAKLANKKIKEILSKGKTPIVTGGTGLYIKALIDGLIEVPKNPTVRNKLNNYYEKFGLEYLYKKLYKLDRETAKTIDRNNPRRVIRALEIYYSTGKKFSVLKKESADNRNLGSGYNFLIFGLNNPRTNLYKNINRRVDKMIRTGLFKEVRKLIKKYSSQNDILQKTIGYKEIIDSMNNKTTRLEAINLIKQNTRNYAKRQITWFKKDKRILWGNTMNNSLKNILNSIRKSGII